MILTEDKVEDKVENVMGGGMGGAGGMGLLAKTEFVNVL
jgi:hypothetical protein